jgi:carboxymethylenebutenolidase
MHRNINVETAEGTFIAYVAQPAVTPAPVVVVVQEIFGVTAGIRQIADGLASQGFVAVCPDLFWRMQPGLQLSEHSESDWKKALDFYTRFDVDAGVRDIAATIDTARRLPEAADKVGVMGFCLGGLMSFLTAARVGVDAAVEYYGGRTEEFVQEGININKPLLMHLAGDDEFMDKQAQATIRTTLASNPAIEIHTYDGRNHAFARPGGGHYHEKDATTANARTLAFFKEHLS